MYMLRFFIASRLASGRDLYFEIACRKPGINQIEIPCGYHGNFMNNKINNKESIVLAGDIGGTKTSLAIFTSRSGPLETIAEATFASKDYPSLEALVLDFFSRIDVTPDRASLGVAGPVMNGHAKITNLPWVMDESTLSDSLGVSSVRLINDLMALAHAVPHLDEKDVHVLNAGAGIEGGTIGVVAPGTGLGEAYLTWDGSRYIPCASEGGHADFAPTSRLEVDLLNYLMKQFEHVSYERVCSGQGLVNIYSYLKESKHAEDTPWVAERIRSADDAAPVIVMGAFEGEAPCILCRTALDTFISILGAEAGNMSLKVLASGGLYLGGGIPPKIIKGLKNGPFMKSFTNKGRMSDLMKNIPVYVILNPDAALLGAAYHGIND
jgi:glucokinase